VKLALLVSTSDCSELRFNLARAGWTARKVSDGATALTRARHENVDAIILVSTGSDMDLTETALNLRDLQPSAEIILLTGFERGGRTRAELLPIARALAKTQILSTEELSGYLAARAGCAHSTGRTRE